MTHAAWDRFSTTGHTPRDALSHWMRWGERAIGAIRVQPRDPARFRGAAARMTAGSATISVMRFSAASAAKATPGEPDDAILFSLPLAGSFRYAHPGADPVLVGPGDIYLRDLSRDWSLSTRGESRLVTLRLPFEDFVARYGDPGPLVGTRFCAGRADVACITGILRSVLPLLQSDGPETRQRVLADTLLDAFRLLAPEPAEDAPADALSLHRQAMLHIARNLGDADLSPATIAAALGVSPRSLQRVFQRRGETMQGVILDQRLARAAEALRASPRPGITPLAMNLGFNDPAYFSRAFAARHGCAPSRYRRHLAGLT
ncbi:helix-turn-helix domain-containing protein [Allosediminivita pacifica]|uniref:AraC-like DNA-binding protein n=1 Tax=Allosediminivita pacifica TaxID=1267769 RepID=A0A2T6AQL3_9RHOB|nr:helix-turn-helix domain-containing protein [Allosediminivita pacifica]PTX46046.1 AraC-like DNA-binding protein [Allosediminivita pacifica]GGB18761.1 hypothetical protein GCM10011324_31130 [Allosediminivita pacifica]